METKQQAISREEAKIIEDALLRELSGGSLESVTRDTESMNLYHVQLQGIRFDCAYTWDEITQMAELCTSILFELREIANGGFTRERFRALEEAGFQEYGEDEEHAVRTVLSVFKAVSTETLESYITELGRVTRVGGAWYMFISRPCMVSSVYSVFDRIIDKFDDTDEWMRCEFFLLRSAMRMHASEKPDEPAAQS